MWSWSKNSIFLLLAVLLCMGSLSAFGEDVVSSSTNDLQCTHEKGHIADRIASVLRKTGLPDEITVMVISALPIAELRGGIPAGHTMLVPQGVPLSQKLLPSLKVYVLAVIGNMIPIPFILLLLGPISRFCMRFKLGRMFFDWLFVRTRRKSADVEKYETLGLTIFVAIPLPVTGGWTGAMVAFVLGLKFHHAMISILMGVMIAGVVMTLLSLLGWIGAAIAFIVLIGLAISGLVGMFKREASGDQ